MQCVCSTEAARHNYMFLQTQDRETQIDITEGL